MKTKYKFINFQKSIVSDATWICSNNKTYDCLGVVAYYDRWKQWVFEGRPACVYSVSCLQDIIHFMGQLN